MRESSQTRLTISNAEFYAYHGVKTEEHILGGKYQVDADLFYDATEAVIKDDVNLAINYEEVLYCIEEIIAGENYSLIETLVNEILNLLLEKFPMLSKASVRVRKMNAPVRRVIKCIEAEQTMIRKEL
jgi:dihydroneopterin aldolase